MISFLAFRQRDYDEVNAIIPAVGTGGSLLLFPLMLSNLHNRQPHTFYMVLVIAGGVLAVELLYFEREVIEEEVEGLDPELSVIEGT